MMGKSGWTSPRLSQRQNGATRSSRTSEGPDDHPEEESMQEILNQARSMRSIWLEMKTRNEVRSSVKEEQDSRRNKEKQDSRRNSPVYKGQKGEGKSSSSSGSNHQISRGHSPGTTNSLSTGSSAESSKWNICGEVSAKLSEIYKDQKDTLKSMDTGSSDNQSTWTTASSSRSGNTLNPSEATNVTVRGLPINGPFEHLCDEDSDDIKVKTIINSKKMMNELSSMYTITERPDTFDRAGNAEEIAAKLAQLYQNGSPSLDTWKQMASRKTPEGWRSPNASSSGVSGDCKYGSSSVDDDVDSLPDVPDECDGEIQQEEVHRHGIARRPRRRKPGRSAPGSPSTPANSEVASVGEEDTDTTTPAVSSSRASPRGRHEKQRSGTWQALQRQRLERSNSERKLRQSKSAELPPTPPSGATTAHPVTASPVPKAPSKPSSSSESKSSASKTRSPDERKRNSVVRMDADAAPNSATIIRKLTKGLSTDMEDNHQEEVEQPQHSSERGTASASSNSVRPRRGFAATYYESETPDGSRDEIFMEYYSWRDKRGLPVHSGSSPVRSFRSLTTNSSNSSTQKSSADAKSSRDGL